VTGCESIELTPASPLNGVQLWKMLVEKFPALADHQKNTRLARNWEYVGAETLFADGDEVALIPPVSGG
jgi:molybdopterin converting factor small subunit